MKVAIISGGFDPIHSGHIAYINSASQLANKLVILLNSDDWLRKKKGQEFMPFLERKAILESLRNVDLVIDFMDDEMGSCIQGLEKVKNMFPDDELIFCNGGDRNSSNIPELTVSGIAFEFNVGGNEKLNSSSWILKNWSYPSENRIWGSFFDLFSDDGVKVKELIVNPQSGMSFQKHFKRNEIWLITKGSCIVNYSEVDSGDPEAITLNKFDQFFVKVGHWHQITNPYDELCKIIEIQYGEETSEDDIERLYYYDNKSL